MQKLYRTNEKFRKKQIKYAKKYSLEHKDIIKKQTNERYANRTPEQIKKRKKYLKKLRSSRKKY